MPEIDPATYGNKPRPDGKPGFMVITPTVMRFHEDVRLDRARIFDERGNFDRSFLLDKMGVPFVDNLSGTEDDIPYLESLRTQAARTP